MSRGRRLAVRFLASVGWYAIWGWFIALPFWGWEMPWEVLRWPLAAILAVLTGWPLQTWIERQPNESEES